MLTNSFGCSLDDKPLLVPVIFLYLSAPLVYCTSLEHCETLAFLPTRRNVILSSRLFPASNLVDMETARRKL